MAASRRQMDCGRAASPRLQTGQFAVKTWPSGDYAKVSGEARKSIESVLSFYGDKSGQWLSELTHKERFSFVWPVISGWRRAFLLVFGT